MIQFPSFIRQVRILIGPEAAIRESFRRIPKAWFEQKTVPPAIASEYAVCLMEKGYLQSALRIIESIQNPPLEVRHDLAYLYLQNHDERARSLYQQIIDDPSTELLTKLSAMGGLSVCLIREAEFAQAEEVLQKLITLYESKRHFWGLAYSWAHLAWTRMARKQGGTSECIRKMEATIAQSTMEYPLFCRFIKEVCHKLGKRTMTTPSPKLRQLIRQNREWNLLREWKLLQNICIQVRPECIASIYYRTNLRGVKCRIKKLSGIFGWKIPSNYQFSLGSGLKSQTVSLLNGTFSKSGETLAPGSAPYRLFRSLALEVHPIHMGDLFSFVFPQEYFLHSASSNRIHQLCHRLRNSLEIAAPGISLACNDGYYEFVCNSHLKVDFVDDYKNLNVGMKEREASSIAILRTEFRRNSFLISEASAFLNKSTRSVNRILSVGLESGILARTGSTRSTIYRFVT